MKKEVFAYLHTHWDREWYQNKEDFNLRFLRVFDIVLDELENNKAPFFYLDGQVVCLLDYLKYRKEKLPLIKKLIEAKKLFIGPYFASIDSYLVSFLSMLNNLDLGLKISKEFNQKDFIGYMSDIFGISKSAFSALKLKNIDKAIIWRGVNPDKTNENCNFLKENIKTTWLVQGYFNDFFHNGNVDGIKNYLEKIEKYSKNSPLLMPIGADHLGILQNANEKIEKINEKLNDYKIILANPFEYFKNVKFDFKTDEEEFLDNEKTYILKGTYSARIYQKIKNVKLQNLLERIVEPLNFYLKENYQKNIEEIYKTLIKNHAHDGICGCSIDSVHFAIDSRQNKVQDMLFAILKRIKCDFKIKKDIIGQSEEKIGLFNLSNFDNIKTLKITLPYKIKNAQILKKAKRGFEIELLNDIYKIPVTEDIVDFYTQIVEISENKKFNFSTVEILKPKKLTNVDENKIENEFIKLSIKNNEVEILNKISKEKVGFYLSDIDDDGDSYNFSPKGEYKILPLLKTKVLYNDKIESALELIYKDIKLDVKLQNKDDFLRFNFKINNKKKNHKLQAVFKLKEKIDETISNDAIGIIKRKIDPDYNIKNFMPAVPPYELKTNTFPMQNFVCAKNFNVITKGLNEYEIFKKELKICLLRGFSTISNPKNKTRAIPAGPDLKTETSQSLGLNERDLIISFGNYEKSFNLIDVLYENYVALDGEFKKEINFELDKIPQNEIFYGINQNKKILYNIKDENIKMI